MQFSRLSQFDKMGTKVMHLHNSWAELPQAAQVPIEIYKAVTMAHFSGNIPWIHSLGRWCWHLGA